MSPSTRERIRRIAPWLLGLAIVAAVASRIPFSQFRASLGSGPHLTLAAVEIGLTLVVLGTDTVSTWIGLRTVQIQWPIARVFALRGATYLLFMLNYAVGQGGFGYYLYRHGTPALRATGATLFLMGTNLATLFVLALVTWSVTGADRAPAVWWTIAIGNAGLAAYLIVIALRPGFLARREVLVPLFEAGVGGHALAIVGRLPHVSVIVLSYWIAMRVWGIDVPFVDGVTLMPVVVLAAVLPISPAGLGTTQAALVFFFRGHAPGATGDDRDAALFAFGIVHFVYSVAGSILVGVLCLPFARRTGAIPPPAPSVG